jgi:pyridoxine 5-phosphate synthase
MDAQLHLCLDSVLSFRKFFERNEPNIAPIALLSEWANIGSLSLSIREEYEDSAMIELKRMKSELNVPISLQIPTEMEINRFALDLQPNRIHLIPSRWLGPRLMGGIDLSKLKDELRNQIAQWHDLDMEIAVQIEPRLELIKQLHRIDADIAVFSTHQLVQMPRGEGRRKAFSALMDATVLASKLGLKVAVSGGLDLASVEQISRINQISEVHVGQALIARSMYRGIEQAIKDFQMAIQKGRQNLL